MPVCQELVRNQNLQRRAVPSRYSNLHSKGRSLISSWLKRAWEQRDCNEEDSFEPFIFSWIALNGWAACITHLDRDRNWIDALSLNQEISAKFQSLLQGSTNCSTYAQSFKLDWPIFKAQAIRTSLGVQRQDMGIRQDVVKYYLDSGIRQYEPQCWIRHRGDPDEGPLDWPHTLAALYRVRCNLFHGEKAVYSKMDRLIVSSAFRVLVYFMQESGYFS
jgi:hypothetical protein